MDEPHRWLEYESGHDFADNTRKPVCVSKQHTKLRDGDGEEKGYADSSACTALK